MREQHDDDKFEDDVNDAVNDTRMRRGGPSSDLSNSVVRSVGFRRWEAKLRRMVSSALERFTSEASGVPNGDALYKAAKKR